MPYPFLPASVFLFFTGLVKFLFQLDNTLACIILACVVVCTVVYVALTLLPLLSRLPLPVTNVWAALALRPSIEIHFLGLFSTHCAELDSDTTST
jgi:hypothetical protein